MRFGWWRMVCLHDLETPISMNAIFQNDKNAEKLTSLVHSGELILFAGSGLSAPVYPRWHEVVAKFCEECSISPTDPLTEEAPVDILTALAEQALNKDEQRFIEYLRRTFAMPIRYKPKGYELLSAIKFKSYVTINFDPLLADEKNRQEYRERMLLSYPDVKTKYLTGQNLFYLHGYIPPGSVPQPNRLVLTATSYQRAYIEEGNVLGPFWDTLLTEHAVLFIGCGLREPEIQTVCRRSKIRKEKLRHDHGIESAPLFIMRPAYFRDNKATNVVERDFQREAEEQVKFADLGIQIVRYDPQNEDHVGLLEVLEFWNPPSPINIYSTKQEVWCQP
ncbi:MAG: SIR2 family protein [Kiritimatiellae bacterium]|nr:SIR2 family protein [Kiritimatiellia bacterium]